MRRRSAGLPTSPSTTYVPRLVSARDRSTAISSPKQELLLALLEDDSAALDAELERITREASSGVQRVRRFAQAMVARGEDSAGVQVHADLWADLLTEDVVRERLAGSTQRRRELVRGWIEEAVASGELVAIPANALASILLALTDGLMLHRALDPGGFVGERRRAIDVLLRGSAGVPRWDFEATAR